MHIRNEQEGIELLLAVPPRHDRERDDEAVRGVPRRQERGVRRRHLRAL